ncbi:molybdopterin molybdotransferase MoeA [Flavobacterium cyclinae]|uniref:molybdopterin molybdotransferase MoeA n=1 Tax=Flavobacterium cyclinae TaxID=2895947 RepID=UPI001E4E3176|nr:molybdopterin molybdotransferase MoeA [Flavobacterium cyclinae]UGS21639.1 molybdopterin molybdotransferase MoeA [Flavobacterium cyclinae]
MITVVEALNILNNISIRKSEITLPLHLVNNYILSQDVFSPINMPPFRQSAMDGFAIQTDENNSYKIIGEIKAGDTENIKLSKGQSVKIFTGAKVPDDANAVIQIEKCSVNESILTIEIEPKINQNIRPIGEQIFINDIALSKDTLLNPAAIGFLAGLGITEVKVYKKPSVGIIVTGNELIEPGIPLPDGKIYESNGIMLQMALSELTSEIQVYKVFDEYQATKQVIENAIAIHDVVLISGGISVGDYDFVYDSLQVIGVQTLFYKVNQKPGKPLFAGTFNDKVILALPGNPAASLTCFYIYVHPILKKIAGNSKTTSTAIKELSHDFVVDNPRSQFLKANYLDATVSVLSHQQSSMLNTFALANCLIYLPEGNYELKKGSKVDIYHI